MSKHIDEELQRLYGIQLQESDPREFAKYHRLAAFELREAYAVNATLAKFVTLSSPVHQGFYGTDIDHMDMLSTGMLGWRVPAFESETALVKYEAGKTWLGRREFAFALFVSQQPSCYLAVRDVSLDLATPMIVRGLNALA